MQTEITNVATLVVTYLRDFFVIGRAVFPPFLQHHRK